MARNKARGVSHLSSELKTERIGDIFSAFSAHPSHLGSQTALVISIDDFVEVASKVGKIERGMLLGPTPRRAAQILGVSRQRVYQLIADGTLQSVEIWSEVENEKSSGFEDILAVMVTWYSLRAYELSGRKPGPKPKPSVSTSKKGKPASPSGLADAQHKSKKA